MMGMIKSGKVDSIVCWKLDRLARNMTEGGQIIDLLSSGVIKVIITNDKVFYPWDNVIVMSVEFSQGKQFVKVVSWYDNEYSYVCQYVRLVKAYAQRLK
jgi:glyceraldehyde-3-phosphate dehydrogenase/erythrose-4-phosphate dehydrogenase